jgi:hypothetical protein
MMQGIEEGIRNCEIVTGKRWWWWKELYSIVAEVEEGIRKCHREKVVVEGIILYCCRGRGRNYKLLHRRGIMM